MLLPMAFLSAYDPPTPPQAPALRRVAATASVDRAGAAHARPARDGFVGQTGLSAARGTRDAARGASAGRRPAFARTSAGRSSRVSSPRSSRISRRRPSSPAFPSMTPWMTSRQIRSCYGSWKREPPIVFTLGSSAVWIAEDFFDTCIAVSLKIGRRALLLAGDAAPALRERVPASIGVFDYAPHSLVMSRASVDRAPGRRWHDRAGATGGQADARRALRTRSTRQRTAVRRTRDRSNDPAPPLQRAPPRAGAVGAALRSDVRQPRRGRRRPRP